MKTKVKRNPLLPFLMVLLVLLLCLPNLWLLPELTFYWFDHTETELQVKAYAEEHHIRYSAYPKSLIELLERNPETETFVLEYPLYEETDYDLNEFTDCETVPLFLQWDQRWGYEAYGSDCIGITGCGPTCLAMVGFYLTGEDFFDPANIAAFAEENDYYAPGHGSSWTLISEGGVKLGLDVTEIPLVEQRITDNLEAGNPIICAMGPGDFTDSGHYIVLTGLQNGKYTVNDPNSRTNSEKLWSYDDIASQIRNLWVIRK